MTEADAKWTAGCLNHEGHIRTRVVQSDDEWTVEVYDDETDAVNSFFPEREIKRFDILDFVQHLKTDE